MSGSIRHLVGGYAFGVRVVVSFSGVWSAPLPGGHGGVFKKASFDGNGSGVHLHAGEAEGDGVLREGAVLIKNSFQRIARKKFF
ncbi:MAG: hypothetical protein JST38_03935 [Bacteroidetes bacterium]|nr:hypothetical protein [Bacteroidota bacterium]